jgi:hypothetical protein
VRYRYKRCQCASEEAATGRGRVQEGSFSLR